MTEQINPDSAKSRFERGSNEELLEHLADHYVGSYFDAIAKQILHRKISYDDTHISVGKKRQLMRYEENYARINKELSRSLRTFLLNRIEQEVKSTAAEDWMTPFELLPPKPEGKDSSETSAIIAYLEGAANAFIECRREVPDSTYGGPPWAKICANAIELWREGDKPSEGTLLKIFGLEHNTGYLFEGAAKQLLDAKQLRLPLHEAIVRIGAPLANSADFKKRWFDEYRNLEKLVRSLKAQWQREIFAMMERDTDSSTRYDHWGSTHINARMDEQEIPEISDLRKLAQSKRKTNETLERHAKLENERIFAGRPPWFSFGQNLSEKQLHWLSNSFPHAHERLMKLVDREKSVGSTPLFVSIASAAGSGIPGTKSISLGLTKNVEPLDETHTPLSGDMTTTKARNELFRAIDEAGSPLVLVEFSSPIPAMEFESDLYAKAKFHTLMQGLCKRLAEGGMVYLVVRPYENLLKELDVLFKDTGVTRVIEGSGNLEYLYEKRHRDV